MVHIRYIWVLSKIIFYLLQDCCILYAIVPEVKVYEVIQDVRSCSWRLGRCQVLLKNQTRDT